MICIAKNNIYARFTKNKKSLLCKRDAMKHFLSTVVVSLSVILVISAHPTYEELRAQVQEEASAKELNAIKNFQKNYIPTLIGLGISTTSFGVGIPWTIKAFNDNNIALASFISGLTALAGYATILTHAQLMADRAFVQQTSFEADQLFNTKMDHLHTRHYMNDIAKFIMLRLEELFKKHLPSTVVTEN
jgi:hypothetical protein